ncbi:MAG: pyridoxal 5'-phosphate synthase glutaminase subunit PdxT [Alphaproteobacteria bacterium]|nr:pyridoxal 5'-phosphate synthase glutaminase subunit PdxT [Alphaproteobacteria bacterium]
MSNEIPVIGVLALQGAVQPHKAHIEAAGAEFRAVKTLAQCEEVDGFILPGGESTTQLKLINRFEMWDGLAEQFAKKPVWGICAGSILLAEKVTNPEQKSFGILPVTIQRNGYGRQIDSHYAVIEGYNVSFIRAPIITGVYGDAEIIAEHDGTPVWVKKGSKMATTFHPELTMDTPSPMHQRFVDLVSERA